MAEVFNQAGIASVAVDSTTDNADREGKAVLTVLDYIGQQCREFRFDLRSRELTGYGRKELEKAVQDELPYLLSSSQIVPGGAEGGAGQYQGAAPIHLQAPRRFWRRCSTVR